MRTSTQVCNGMSGGDLVVKYVGYKVSKVRWQPQPSGAIESSEIFASGSWDDEVNTICIWRFTSSENTADTTPIVEPVALCEVGVVDDVTDLRFLDEEKIVGSFSNGSIALYKYRPVVQSLGIAHVWEGLHRLKDGRPCSCTALAVSGTTIVTGGGDGRINVVRVEDQHPVRTIEKADNNVVTALTCTMQSEVLSTSSSGQLKIWDLRKPHDTPVRIMENSDEYLPIQSMDRHPHQPHLVVLGRGDGSMCFWDLRQEGQPVSLIQAHSSHVWDVKFHHSYPNNLFTCSQDGSLWHWDAALSGPGQSNISMETSHLTSPWLSGAVAQGKVDITNHLPDNILPVNSLDIESKHLVCGTDGEALYVVRNLTLR